MVPFILIGAVRLLHRPGLHQPQIGAAARLGQAHGAGPFARHHLGHDVLLHPVGAGGDQRAIGAGRQHGIHGQRLVGAHSHLAHRHGHQCGHARAAKFGRRAQAAPARLAIGFVGFLEALGRAHHAILEMAAFLVARLVERLQHFLAELARIGENVVDQVGRQVLEAGQVAMLFQPPALR